METYADWYRIPEASVLQSLGVLTAEPLADTASWGLQCLHFKVLLQLRLFCFILLADFVK